MLENDNLLTETENFDSGEKMFGKHDKADNSKLKISNSNNTKLDSSNNT